MNKICMRGMINGRYLKTKGRIKKSIMPMCKINQILMNYYITFVFSQLVGKVIERLTVINMIYNLNC